MFPYNPCENNWLSETKKDGQVNKKPGHLLSGQPFVDYLKSKLDEETQTLKKRDEV